MYKSTSEGHDNVARVASFSTKPSATGRFRDIPAWAREPEEYYQSIKKQFDSLTEQLHALRERVMEANRRLRQTLPFEEARRLRAELSRDAPLLKSLEVEVGSFRELTRATAKGSFGWIYWYCAERILDKETRIKIQKEVMEIIGRTATDGIRKPKSEVSEERKSNRKAQEVHRADRLKFRETQPGQLTRTVWSDEGGGKTNARLPNLRRPKS